VKTVDFGDWMAMSENLAMHLSVRDKEQERGIA
jgi:hypothetical protein